MKCLSATIHLHLAGICKWIWTAFSFGLLWSNVHNEAIWEGRWKWLCIMFIFVATGNNWRIHSIFTCLEYWRIVLYWYDVYLNFWQDLNKKEIGYFCYCVKSCVRVLRVGESDRYLFTKRSLSVGTEKGECVIDGRKRVSSGETKWKLRISPITGDLEGIKLIKGSGRWKPSQGSGMSW